jgi:hypothetical protein
MDFERLQFLLQRYFDQMLTVEERAELSTMLLASSRARDEFWEGARWHALIRQWGEAEWGRRDAEIIAVRPIPAPVPARPASSTKIIPFPRRRFHIPKVAWAAAAAVALLAGSLFYVPWKKAPTVDGTVSSSLAVLTHSADPVWAEGSGDHQSGEGLSAGWLKLKSGAVQLEFSRGARVVLEGPAELELLNDNEAFLSSGKLRAHVPDPAHGFTVRSKGFSVVDHGTEFGVDLPVTGDPQVHVFKGLVALQRGKAAQQELHKDQAVQIEGERVKEIPARLDQFLSDEELARRERASVRGRLLAWKAASHVLSEHPAALVHLDFEGDRGWARNIPNRAWQAIPEAPATMVGCDFADGRWPGKGAVEFNRPDDRLRLNVSGGYQSMTLVAWVRVDSLPDRPQSLVMADGMGTGDVQWYLSRWGELGFGVHIGKKDDPTGWRYHHTQPVITSDNLGAWVCLASSYDGTTDTVTHYFNGQPVGADRLGVRTLLQLETFEIGNWALRPGDQRLAGVVPRSNGDSARNLHGRMDELAIFSAPLSADEIRQIYEAVQVTGGGTEKKAANELALAK